MYPWYAFCCSVTKSCPTLCDPIDCSTPGFTVHHLPEFTLYFSPPMSTQLVFSCQTPKTCLRPCSPRGLLTRTQTWPGSSVTSDRIRGNSLCPRLLAETGVEPRTPARYPQPARPVAPSVSEAWRCHKKLNRSPPMLLPASRVLFFLAAKETNRWLATWRNH